ncbi:MAG: molybdate ABC transporter substrate-binding protein [Rhodospirillaceae bacterium]
MVQLVKLCLAAALLLAALVPGPVAAGDVLIFAAASLKNALDEVAELSRKDGGAVIRVSYAASSALARQIENRAPADLFISADLEWMDYLDQRQLIESASRINLLGNRLVLVAPASSAAPFDIAPGFPLGSRLGAGRLAIGDPAHVPAGKYAQAALEYLGVWPDVAKRLAPADSVRAALALVARGEAPLGIVYDTDAQASPGVTVIGRFPADSHPPIIYPAALVAARHDPDAAAFLSRLRSPTAATVFLKAGFAVLTPPR